MPGIIGSTGADRSSACIAWTSTEGFGVHWDDHDTIVVQLDGAKRWRIYGTTRPYPLYRDIEDPGEAPTEPVADLVLHPGDVLYVPRGAWHAVCADQGVRSLHVTCGLQARSTCHAGARSWRSGMSCGISPDLWGSASLVTLSMQYLLSLAHKVGHGRAALGQPSA